MARLMKKETMISNSPTKNLVAFMKVCMHPNLILLKALFRALPPNLILIYLNPILLLTLMKIEYYLAVVLAK
jgi:hypothetical protein